MLFGDQENPKVISWGNPGFASEYPRQSARLAAGRRTENAGYVRRYVPVITAATADYRVEPVRVDTATRKSMTFVSMSTEHRSERLSGPFSGRVYAIDANGELHGWGFNPAGAGDPRNPSAIGEYVFTSPIPLRTTDDRAADARTVSFKKVVPYGQASGVILALSESGVLYGTGNLALDNADSATTASFEVLRPVSTQAWKDVVTFGSNQNVMAIRDDGTLWTTSRLRSTASSQTSQVKGVISSIYLSSPYTQTTNRANFLSLDTSRAPIGGRQLVFSVRRKSTTSAYEVQSVGEAGLFYTALPTVTFSLLENTNNQPSVTLEMMPETGWEQLSSSGDYVLLLNRSNGVSKVYVAYDNYTPNDFMPQEDPDYVGNRGVQELRHLPGATNHSTNKYENVTAVHMAQGYFERSAFPHPLSAFFIQNVTNTSKSNMLALGDNAYGQLAVGSTAKIIRLPTEVPSPDAKDFIVRRVASSRINTFAIRHGDDVPGFEGTHVQHLYTAGMPEFSGGTTATASMLRFTPVLGVNGTSSKWEHVFAFGEDEADHTSRTVALHFASYSTVPADVVQ